MSRSGRNILSESAADYRVNWDPKIKSQCPDQVDRSNHDLLTNDVASTFEEGCFIQSRTISRPSQVTDAGALACHSIDGTQSWLDQRRGPQIWSSGASTVRQLGQIWDR